MLIFITLLQSPGVCKSFCVCVYVCVCALAHFMESEILGATAKLQIIQGMIGFLIFWL